MATALATPFYLDMGFTKSEIGLIAKNAGLWAECRGRHARRHLDAAARDQPRPLALRRRAARVDPRLRVARLRESAGRAAPGRRDRDSRRSASASARPRSSRSSRAPPTRVTPRRSLPCSRASPPCRERWSMRRPAGSSSRSAGSHSSCSARCSRYPEWRCSCASRPGTNGSRGLLARRDAAVDVENLSGDERRRGRAEEQRRRRSTSSTSAIRPSGMRSSSLRRSCGIVEPVGRHRACAPPWARRR